MSGKAAVTVVLKPGGNKAPEAPQKSFPFVLKKIMDIPPPNILEEGEDGKIEMQQETKTSAPFVYVYTDLTLLTITVCAQIHAKGCLFAL